MQDLLGWKNLTVADREAFSEYIEAERTCLQTMSDPDPEQALQALDLNPEHNDPVYRAARHIKSPAHLQLFYEKSAVGSQGTARARITADAEILTSRRLCTPREGPEKPVASGAEIGAMSQGIRSARLGVCDQLASTKSSGFHVGASTSTTAMRNVRRQNGRQSTSTSASSSLLLTSHVKSLDFSLQEERNLLDSAGCRYCPDIMSRSHSQNSRAEQPDDLSLSGRSKREAPWQGEIDATPLFGREVEIRTRAS